MILLDEIRWDYMKNYSLQPTDENAIELLRTDPIGRNDNVFRFVELLNNIDELTGAYILAGE